MSISKWAPFLSLSVFFLSCFVFAAPKAPSTLIDTRQKTETPVSVSTHCELHDDDLEIQIGRVGTKNSAHLVIKDISVYRLNNKLRLPYPAWKEEVDWGEVTYWDKYGAQWSILSGSSDSQCALKFDRVQRDEDKRLVSFDLRVDCKGLSNPQVDPTREFHISEKNPISCQL